MLFEECDAKEALLEDQEEEDEELPQRGGRLRAHLLEADVLLAAAKDGVGENLDRAHDGAAHLHVRLEAAVVVRRLRFLSLLVVGDPSAVSTHSLLVQAAAAAAAAATEAVVASSAS